MEKKDRVDFKVLSDNVKFLESLMIHFDSRSNWLIGISSVLVVVTTSNFEKLNNLISKLGAIILIVGCCYAIYQFLFNLIPSHNLFNKSKKKKGPEKNIFCYRSIERDFTKKSILEYIHKMSFNDEETIKVFANKIYDLGSNRLPKKIKRLKNGGLVFINSFVLGSIMIIIGILI
jgi:hypothetical protein